MDGVVQIEVCDQGREIVGVVVHVVAVGRVGGAAVSSAVVRDHPIAVPDEEKHLGVPVVGGQRPALAEHDRLPRTPVLVEDLDVVVGRDGGIALSLSMDGWTVGIGGSTVGGELGSWRSAPLARVHARTTREGEDVEPVEINAGAWYLRALRADALMDDRPALADLGETDPGHVHLAAAEWTADIRYRWAVCEPATGELLAEVALRPATGDVCARARAGHDAAANAATEAVRRFASALDFGS